MLNSAWEGPVACRRQRGAIASRRLEAARDLRLVECPDQRHGALAVHRLGSAAVRTLAAQQVRRDRDEAIGGELRCDGSAEQAARADNDRDSITHGINSVPVPLRAEGTFAPRRQSAGLHRFCHCAGLRTIR